MLDATLNTDLGIWCDQINATRTGLPAAYASPLDVTVVRRKLTTIVDGNASVFDQSDAGCCGFAAALMALANHAPLRFQAFCRTVFHPRFDAAGVLRPSHLTGGLAAILKGAHGRAPGKLPLAAAAGFNIGKRLAGRENLPYFNLFNNFSCPEKSINTALMIFFKEHLRADAAGAALWQSCIDFTREFGNVLSVQAGADKDANFIALVDLIFANREKARKERERRTAPIADHARLDTEINALRPRTGFSPKKGDLALPPAMVERLVTFVFGTLYGAGDAPLRLNAAVVKEDVLWRQFPGGPYATMPAFMTEFNRRGLADAQRELNRITLERFRNAATNARYCGSVLGLATAGTLGVDTRFDPHHRVGHWVFLPPPASAAAGAAAIARAPNPAAGAVNDVRLWTWGDVRWLPGTPEPASVPAKQSIAGYCPMWMYHIILEP